MEVLFNYSNAEFATFAHHSTGGENDHRDDSWRGVQLQSDGSWQIAVRMALRLSCA